MQRAEKENKMPTSARKSLSPRPEISIHSMLPLPKSSDVKRKRYNRTSPPSLRSAVGKSPKRGGRKHLSAIDTEERKNVIGSAKRIVARTSKTPSKGQTPKPPSRCVNKDLFNSQYFDQEIEFEANQSSLQSILDNTGIQSTPSAGRQTLAAAPFKRTSIYAPHKEMNLNTFKQICDKFAQGSSKPKREDALTQQSEGTASALQGGRRMTTDSLFSPKRRCLEKSLSRDKIQSQVTQGILTPQNILKSRVSRTLNHGPSVEFEQSPKPCTLEVLTEEKMEDKNFSRKQGESDYKENIGSLRGAISGHKDMSATNKQGEVLRKTQVNPNIGVGVSVPKTPLRVLKNETPSRVLKDQTKALTMTPDLPLRMIKGITDDAITCMTPKTPLRVMKNEGMGKVMTPQTPGRILREKVVEELSTPVRVLKVNETKSQTPMRVEKVVQELSTPVRVLKVNETKSQTPMRVEKVVEELSTPVRVLKVNETKSQTPMRVEKTVEELSTPVRVLKVNETKCQTPMRVEKKKGTNRELKQQSIFATPMRVLKHGRNFHAEQKSIAQDSKMEQKETPTDLRQIAMDLNDIQTELWKHSTDVNKSPVSDEDGYGEDLSRTEEDTERHLSFDSLDGTNTAVWRIKPSTYKTPVKKEVLTSTAVESCRNQRKVSGEIVEPCQVDKTHGNDHRTAVHENTVHSAQYTSTMQLPVGLGPVEKSGSNPEMPNPASKSWGKSETGLLTKKDWGLEEKLKTSTEVTKNLIGSTSKSCDMSTANQNLLDRIQQHLERKLQGLGESRTKDTDLLNRGSNENNLNVQNNNLVVTGNISVADGENTTAGQLNNNTLSQGFDSNITNANGTTPFDINYNIGTSEVTHSSKLFDEVLGNKSDNTYMSDAHLNEDMYHDQGPSTELTDVSGQTHDEGMPFKLRNIEIKQKVVTNDSINLTIETPRNDENWNTFEKKEVGNKHFLDVCEAESENTSKLYAPTPYIQRARAMGSPKAMEVNSNIPLLTPLALRMVAKRQQYGEESFTSQVKETEQLFMEDDTGFETEQEAASEYKIMFDPNLEQDNQNTDAIADLGHGMLVKTPPSAKSSAFHVVRKSSLTPLVGSMSLRGNSEGHGKIRTRRRSKDKGHKQMLLTSLNEKYHDAMLDEEVTRFAARLVSQHVGYFPRGCCNPVARILMDGDDMTQD